MKNVAKKKKERREEKKGTEVKRGTR